MPASTSTSKTARRSAVAIGLCTVVALGLTPPATADQRSPLGAALDSVVAAGAPGSYAATGTGERAVAGVAALGTHRSPDASGRFRAASVTKPFVATVVLQLVAEGRIGLDDPVAEHLPGLLPYPEPITIRQLLGHTSGLPRDIPPWNSLEEVDTGRWDRFTPTELVRLATDGVPLLFGPGTDFSYSNTGYTVLGMLVERVTGRSLATELTRRIIAPLGLWDTALPSAQPFLLRPAARGYEYLYGEDAPPTDVTTYVMSRAWAAGNLVSSARDLNRFFDALLDGRLLPEEQLTEMKKVRPGALGSFDYGLGLMSIASPCGGPDWWGHGGDFPGYNTWSLHTEDTGRQVTAGMNLDVTAPVDAHAAMVNQVLPAELCDGATPRTMTRIDPPDLR
ncbi:serine hydrolase domain-containing protein [Prauserella cavernicola]|uniref:Beta-lactamase family protein n=1 Tax=Prauserella cavernicola TaxID=2800127 RepID=A0A934V7E0_9PSEU|nr:serine hydrolase domain-containing protein [Prauserella cavernicola]MBK1786643.1 beta-lactamase family protein [Prauserella cavernicola]